MVFEERLQDVQRLQTQGMFSQAIKDCSTIIEQVLEKFYKEIWAYLNSDEKQKIINIERKFSKKKTPLDTLGLGRWINFYEESNMPKLIFKHRGINASTFDFKTLAKVNEIRNRCTHENYPASQEEFKEIYDYTIQLLKATGLIKKEPVGIRHVPKERAQSKSQVLADQIRLLLASDPSFELEEEFEVDFGLFSPVLGKWEFVGAASSENLVRVLLLQDVDSSYHHDAEDMVYERVLELVKERIRKKLPQSRGIKIEVSITDNISDWGYYSAEVEL